MPTYINHQIGTEPIPAMCFANISILTSGSVGNLENGEDSPVLSGIRVVPEVTENEFGAVDKVLGTLAVIDGELVYVKPNIMPNFENPEKLQLTIDVSDIKGGTKMLFALIRGRKEGLPDIPAIDINEKSQYGCVTYKINQGKSMVYGSMDVDLITGKEVDLELEMSFIYKVGNEWYVQRVFIPVNILSLDPKNYEGVAYTGVRTVTAVNRVLQQGLIPNSDLPSTHFYNVRYDKLSRGGYSINDRINEQGRIVESARKKRNIKLQPI